MKIIQIIPNLGYGGAEKFCIELANELGKTNEVSLISLYEYDELTMLPKNLINENINLIFLNKKKGFDLKIIISLLLIILKKRPDIINTHLNALMYIAIPYLFFYRRVKIFHTVHNLADKEVGKFLQKVYNIFFNYLKIYPIAISHEVLKSIKKIYGNKHNYLINNGINKPAVSLNLERVNEEIASYKLNDKTKVFLNVGRINKQKNQESLLRVFAEHKQHLLLIIGNADINNIDLKEKLLINKPDNVIFLDNKNNVGDYMSLVDFFILSSSYEGLPITLLEAMSLGSFVLSTPVGGIPDVIENKVNGLLSKGISDKEINDIILTSLDYSENEILTVKNNAEKTFLNKFTMKICSEEYFQLYSLV
ncbi:glycosyltransferase [Elizabethkingia ursingii]|nr:glycosyltransferase [Elizabethkingia ursingii]MDR2229247.1 glycosyltransferase [Flavobacteriaceae bacterium]